MTLSGKTREHIYSMMKRLYNTNVRSKFAFLKLCAFLNGNMIIFLFYRNEDSYKIKKSPFTFASER